MNNTLYPSRPVLLVDDEMMGLKSLELALRSGGITHVLLCNDSREVMPLLSQRSVDVVLLDLTMPNLSGEELLPLITRDFPEIPVIVITGLNQVETAVRCMQAKAFDYMVKPVEKSRVVSGVRRAVELRELQRQYMNLKSHMLSDTLERPDAFSAIITRHKKMHAIFQYAESVAGSPQPVLISGETGVGKELMARAIHRLSNRQGAFISVNVAGIDDNVFSDTLFGHTRGAFTGAGEVRRGLIEKASGGTLHLDEIGDLNPDSQVKLLRLLQEGEYFPLGSDLPKITHARVVVSTNQDLPALQQSGRFRKDLYYRLRAHHLHIPPLRERPEDVPLLLNHFLKEASESMGKKQPSFPAELPTLLAAHHFPGNVRELRAMVYDAVSNHKAKILSMERFKAHIDQERSLPCDVETEDPGPSPPYPMNGGCGPFPTLQEATQLHIAQAMRKANNNQSMAARLLGISRQRLGRLLKGCFNS